MHQPRSFPTAYAPLWRCKRTFSVEAIQADLEAILRLSSFEAGYLGHTISLPAESQVIPEFRQQIYNVPFVNGLGACPTFKEIFEMFEAPVAAFRLLRTPGSAFYGPHTDKGVLRSPEGTQIQRFQIPIVTSRQARLCISLEDVPHDPDYVEYTYEEGKRSFEAVSAGVPFEEIDHVQLANYTVDNFLAEYQGARAIALQAGTLYSFEAHKVHMLANDSQEERVTLVVDMVAGSELEAWQQTYMVSCPPSV